MRPPVTRAHAPSPPPPPPSTRTSYILQGRKDGRYVGRAYHGGGAGSAGHGRSIFPPGGLALGSTLRARPSPTKQRPFPPPPPLIVIHPFLSPLLAMAVRAEAHAARSTSRQVPTERRRCRRCPSPPPLARPRSQSVPKPKRSDRPPSRRISRCVRPRGRQRERAPSALTRVRAVTPGQRGKGVCTPQ